MEYYVCWHAERLDLDQRGFLYLLFCTFDGGEDPRDSGQIIFFSFILLHSALNPGQDHGGPWKHCDR